MITSARGARIYTGKPCRRGHSGERYESNHNCVACSRENTPAWKLAHPGSAKRYYAADKKRINTRNKRYHAANRERINARHRQHHAARRASMQNNQQENF